MNKIFILFSLFVMIVSCEINQKEFLPTDEFVKIYNDPNQDKAWYPVGIIQTTDKGFLILNGVKSDSSQHGYPYATVLKTTQEGELVNTLSTNLLAPVPGFLSINENVAFVAMDEQTNSRLVYLDDNGTEELQSVALGTKQPLYAYSGYDGNTIVLSYNNVSNSSIVTIYSPSIDQINQTNLNIIDNSAGGLILNHMNRTGFEQPFFIGDWQTSDSKGYFVNCLSNYTLRSVFIKDDGSPTGGDIYSFQDRDALSSLLHINDNLFSFTRYYAGNNYLSVNVEVDMSASRDVNDLEQNKIAELVPGAKVISKKVSFEEAEYYLFASSTNSNSLVIYQYEPGNDKQPVKTLYFDFENNLEVVDFIQDKYDDGIVVLGRVYLTGRYLRPLLVKIKKEDFVN